MDRHSTLMFQICHDSALKEDERVHFQLAVLYTTPDRRRRIRVHNYSSIATHKPTVVFRNSDIEAVLGCLAKDAVDRALTCPLSEEGSGARYFLDNAICNALYKYRLHCSPASPSGQLVLPDSMKIMPVFILGMLKHPSLMENKSAVGTVSSNSPVCNTQSLLTNSGSNYIAGCAGGPNKLAFTPSYESALSRVAVRAHERSYELRRLLTAPLIEMVNSIYPRMYNFSSLFDDMEALFPEVDYSMMSRSTDEANRPMGGEDNNESSDSINVSDEYINNSMGSVSFNNILSRQTNGLQTEHPNAANASIGTMLALSASRDAEMQQSKHLSQLAAKAICTLCPSAEVFEADQIYLLDDRTYFYMYVGRGIPKGVLEELFVTTPGTGGLGRSNTVSFNTATSELSRRMAAFLDVLRSKGAHKQGLIFIQCFLEILCIIYCGAGLYRIASSMVRHGWQ